MEVLVPQPPAIAASPLSAPSSPRPSFSDHPASYYFYASAPSSPSRMAAVYSDLYGAWEENPPAAADAADGDEVSDFSFSFHAPSAGERASPALAAADDLFEGGMIRPSVPVSGGRSTSSSAAKEGLRRDRGRALSSSSSATAAPSRGRRATRSLSPLRGEGEAHHPSPSSSSSSFPATVVSALCKRSESKKWKLKDLFLFRSASEGRATATGSRDPLRKHTFLPSSSSLAEGGGGGSESRRRGTATSAHGMYYTANRAASEEMKKKTSLPYQSHGLFGYLSYNPAIHSIKKGLSGPFFSRRQP